MRWPGDIEKLFERYNIEYVTSGPNTKSGEISIQCPFCGDDDPSHHMGINLSNGTWACWRDSGHRGRRPHRLLMALTRLDMAAINALLKQPTQPDTQNFCDKVRQGFATKQDTYQNMKLEFPPEFKKLDMSRTAVYFRNYLEGRGFGSEHLMEISNLYNLHYALEGSFKWRIIFPVYMNGSLVTWSGRTITPTDDLRYKTLSYDREKVNTKSEPCAILNIKDTLFNYDEIIKGGTTLFVTEGQMDAVKMDFFGKEFGCRATCLFNTQLSQKQEHLLRTIAPKYKNVIVLFDNGAVDKALKIVMKLSGVFPGIGQLPNGVDDPGDLSESQVMDICKMWGSI